MALINPKCIGEPELCLRSDALMSVRQTRHSYSQLTESEKAEFHTPAIPNVTRNCVKHHSTENISQGLVHPNKSDTEASVSFDFKSEEREEIRNCRCTVTCTYTCTCTGEDRGTDFSHSRIQKVNKKNFGKPASSFSDFYM